MNVLTVDLTASSWVDDVKKVDEFLNEAISTVIHTFCISLHSILLLSITADLVELTDKLFI